MGFISCQKVAKVKMHGVSEMFQSSSRLSPICSCLHLPPLFPPPRDCLPLIIRPPLVRQGVEGECSERAPGSVSQSASQLPGASWRETRKRPRRLGCQPLIMRHYFQRPAKETGLSLPQAWCGEPEFFWKRRLCLPA